MEQRLKEIFSNVNEWLKFAEAKNAAIIAFNAAVIFAVLNFIERINDVGSRYVYTSCVLFLSISLILALLSFFPITKMPWIRSDPSEELPIKKDNLIFFTYIRKYQTIGYLEKLIGSTNNIVKGKTGLTEIEYDYANQIITNSKIAFIKYLIFKLSLVFNIAGITLFCGYYLITAFHK